jgi:putative FmdB family regulatory protein
MPTYEYKCPKCGMTAVVIRKIDEKERKPICVNDAMETVRVFDPPPIRFEGKGWGKD